MPPLRRSTRPRPLKATIPQVDSPQAAPRPDSDVKAEVVSADHLRVTGTASHRPDRLTEVVLDGIFSGCW